MWETTFVIRNTGKTTILGDGFSSKNIKDDCLPFQISNCEKVLSATITNCNNSSKLDDCKLYFTQWKQDEFVEIALITEGEEAPYLRISDRDIIDSEITYSEYSPKVVESNKKLIDSFPKGIATFLKWLHVVFVAMTILVIPFLIYDDVKKSKKKEEQEEQEEQKEQKEFSVLETVIIDVIAFLAVILFIASPLLWMF